MEDTSGANQLVGTWKLVSIQFEFEDTRERVDMYGPNPLGYLVLTDGSLCLSQIISGYIDKSYPAILMMQPAQDRQAENAASRLDSAPLMPSAGRRRVTAAP